MVVYRKRNDPDPEKRLMLCQVRWRSPVVVIVMSVEFEPMRMTPSVPRFVVLTAKFASGR